MNNQKDTQSTDTNSYGHTDVSNDKMLINKPVYEFANKKTEKLVTALYMVTDCMDIEDALKSKLRSLGVELLSDMYKFSTLSPMDKHSHISSSLSRIYEIISFVEISSTIGYISDMNTSILKKEFLALITELKSYQSKDKHFTFTLNEHMFDLPIKSGEENIEAKSNFINNSAIKDISIPEIKRTIFNTMSFINNKTNVPVKQPKRHSVELTNFEKENRTNKIILLIKNSSNGQIGVSIKDISTSFTDCSEKTIQRELNSLVSKGQLKKTGAKRWSRYELI